MRGRVVPAALVASAFVCASLAGGCTSRDEAKSVSSTAASVPRAPDGRALQPVSLPDLSKMTESVQKQIRERYSSLMLKVANPGTPLLELSDGYGEMGKLLMAAKYPDAAEPCLLNAQTLVPSDFRWPYYLAHLYRTDKGDLTKALAHFERAVQLKPDDVAALVWLGDVYLAQGRPEAAEAQFAKALSLFPGSLSARFGLGRTALAKQDYRRAVDYLEEGLRMDPEAAGIHYPLAMAYRGLGESKNAEVHLRQRREKDILPADPLMVELDGLLQSPQTYETLGIQALESKDWPAAAAHFRKGLELEPANSSLRYRLGTAMFLMGDARGAQEQFEEAVRVSPDNARAHYTLGVLMAGNGRHKEAIERFSTALSHEPNYAEARLRLAASLRRVGRAKESLSQYQEVIKADPGASEARFGYAMALVQMGRYQEARDRLTEGMKNSPDQPLFAHALARLLAAAPDDRVRDGQQAMLLMQELTKQQKSIELGETLAMALAESGQFDQAAGLQRELMAVAERSGLTDLGRHLADNLTLYERREPCRTPWRNGEIP